MIAGARAAGIEQLRNATAIEWPRGGACGSRISEPADRWCTAIERVARQRVSSRATVARAAVGRSLCVRCAADSLRAEPVPSGCGALRALRIPGCRGRGGGTALVADLAAAFANALANGPLQLSHPEAALVVRARRVLYGIGTGRAALGAAGARHGCHGTLLAARASNAGPMSHLRLRPDRQHERSLPRVWRTSDERARGVGALRIVSFRRASRKSSQCLASCGVRELCCAGVPYEL